MCLHMQSVGMIRRLRRSGALQGLLKQMEGAGMQ